MLCLLVPDPAKQHSIQNAEHFAYWSRLTGFFLRKHGFIFHEMPGVTMPPTADDDYLIVTRGVPDSVHGFRAGLYEGPFPASFLNALQLNTIAPKPAEQVELEFCAFDSDNNLPLQSKSFGYASDQVRRIPENRADESKPYRFLDADQSLNPRHVPVQQLDPGPGWQVLARVRMAGENRAVPVAITNGTITLLGLPLFDLVVRKHWMPRLDVGYFALGSRPPPREAELWLACLIQKLASSGQRRLFRLAHWPHDFNSALTLRLDHDRALSSAALDSLLASLKELKVRASWGLLVKNSAHDLIHRIASHGHEVTLHSEASSYNELSSELSALRALGAEPVGVTSHGGIGSSGHLGQVYFDWAERANLRHADILSRDNLWPHPSIAAGNGLPQMGAIMLPGLHRSLDTGTAPDAHRFKDLAEIIPSRLAAGEHVNVMNHPDIHQQELLLLLRKTMTKSVWAATHEEVCEWSRMTKFGWKLEQTEHDHTLVFGEAYRHRLGIYEYRNNEVHKQWATTDLAIAMTN